MPTPRPLLDVFAVYREPEVWLLGLTQTIGYGALYYAHAVLAPHIARDLGLTLEMFFGLFSLTLLAGAFAAPVAGRAMDARGAPQVMTAGAPFAALGLLAMAHAQGAVSLGLGLALVDVAAACVLYDGAFATMAQMHGRAARPRITAITLIAGFASTIFWPLTTHLAQEWGWRGCLLIYAALMLAVCFPAHAWLRGRRRRAGGDDGEHASDATAGQLPADARRRAMLLFGIAICVSGLAYAAIPIHIIGVVSSRGFSAEDAALVAAIIGPMQVIARMIDVAFGRRFDAMMTCRAALVTLVAALGLLMIPGIPPLAVFAFAALYGVSQGLITIARGTVPLQLFGVHGYATLMGRITGWRFLVNAAAPYVFAVLAARVSINGAIGLLLISALFATVAFAMIRPASASAARD